MLLYSINSSALFLSMMMMMMFCFCVFLTAVTTTEIFAFLNAVLILFFILKKLIFISGFFDFIISRSSLRLTEVGDDGRVVESAESVDGVFLALLCLTKVNSGSNLGLATWAHVGHADFAEEADWAGVCAARAEIAQVLVWVSVFLTAVSADFSVFSMIFSISSILSWDFVDFFSF